MLGQFMLANTCFQVCGSRLQADIQSNQSTMSGSNAIEVALLCKGKRCTSDACQTISDCGGYDRYEIIECLRYSCLHCSGHFRCYFVALSSCSRANPFGVFALQRRTHVGRGRKLEQWETETVAMHLGEKPESARVQGLNYFG